MSNQLCRACCDRPLCQIYGTVSYIWRPMYLLTTPSCNLLVFFYNLGWMYYTATTSRLQPIDCHLFYCRSTCKYVVLYYHTRPPMSTYSHRTTSLWGPNGSNFTEWGDSEYTHPPEHPINQDSIFHDLFLAERTDLLSSQRRAVIRQIPMGKRCSYLPISTPQ